MRAVLVTIIACASLVAAAPAGAADRGVERGIVQAIERQAVVLRALDGTDVTIPLRPETRLRLNGRRASLTELRVGLVAEAVLDGAGNALVLRAFGAPAVRVVRGVLLRVRLAALVVRRPGGTTIRIPLAAATTVWRNGGRVRLRALRLGMLVDVERAPDGSAAAVVVLRGP